MSKSTIFPINLSKLLLQIFILIVISHLFEHIAQMFQLYALNWSRKDCLGILGLFYPWLVRSEWLHYGHALFMLLGWVYLKFVIFTFNYDILKYLFNPIILKLVKNTLFYWYLTFVLAFYHHIEHFLLLLQVIFNYNLFNSSVPISIGQLFVPRIELHFIYNLMIFIPMMVTLILSNKLKRLN